MREAPSGLPADRPLQVAIEDDQLVIRVGVDTFVFAAERCPRFYEGHDDNVVATVSDKAEFMNDIIRALQDGEEDGTTPIDVLFDNAIESAWENGAPIEKVPPQSHDDDEEE